MIKKYQFETTIFFSKVLIHFTSTLVLFGLIHLTKKGLQLQENNNYKNKVRKAEIKGKLLITN